MSKWKDGEWILNFFEGQPDDYHVPLGALRACVNDAPTIKPCEDAISRSALIEKARWEAEGMDEPFKSNLEVIVSWLAEKLPFVAPSRPSGEWVDTGTAEDGDTEVKCSECGEVLYWRANYCPNCGARMI